MVMFAMRHKAADAEPKNSDSTSMEVYFSGPAVEAHSMSVRDLAPALLGFSDALVGHNIQRFDVPFLLHAVIDAGLHMPASTVIDTLPIAQQLLPELPNHKLVTLVQVLGIGDDESHRASDDARQDALVYEALKAYAKKNHIRLQ